MAAQSPVSAVANAMDEMSFGSFHWRVMTLIIAGLSSTCSMLRFSGHWRRI